MKFKNLLKVGFPIVSTSLLAVSLTACSTQTTSSGVDVIHNDGTTASYSSFEDAMNHAISGDYFVLKGDVNLTSPITMKSLNAITIEGAGYTFTFDESANAEAILSFENCTNLTLSGFGVTGGQADSGIKVRNGNVNFYDVVVAGQYKNALYLAGNAGADINDSIFETIGNDKSTEQTIYVSGDTTSVVTLNNVMADSMFIDSKIQPKKKVEFKSDCSIRYVRILPEEERLTEDKVKMMNTFLTGYKNISHLWFVGAPWELEGVSDEINVYYSYSETVNRIGAFYVVTPKGLRSVADSYANVATTDTGFEYQVHLMNNIDYNVDDNGYWSPIDNGKARTADPNDTGDQLTKFTLLDGHGHTISNLQINHGERTIHAVGFFGTTGSVLVKDIAFDNCRLEMEKGKTGLQNAGMVFGRVTGSAKLHNVTVSNSYIGAKQKAASFVGIIESGHAVADSPTLDLKQLACVEMSGCISENNTIVNKTTGDDDDVDVYLGGLVGWLAYHSVALDGTVTHSGYMIIDNDPAKPTYLIDPHFNWQQEMEDWDTRFEMALLFLYGRKLVSAGVSNYRQCNSYNNVIVRYSGE